MLRKVVKFAVLGSLFLINQTVEHKAEASRTPETFGEPKPPRSLQPCKDFTLIDGKATTATTLWLLGEVHASSGGMNEKSIQCLEKLTNSVGQHRVYLESYPAGKEIPCRVAKVSEKAGRQCVGWDDETAGSAVEEVFMYLQVHKHVQGLEKVMKMKQFTDQGMDDFIKKLAVVIQDSPQSTEKSIIEKLVNYMTNSRKKGSSYKEIFTNHQQKVNSAQQKLHKENDIRNKAMMKQLNESPDTLFSVVIAGKGHLSRESEIGAAEYVQNELRKGKHQNRYAILAMN